MSTGTQEAHSGETATDDTPGSTVTDPTDSETPTLNATISVGYVQRFLDAIRTLDDEFHLTITPDGVTARVLGAGSAVKATVGLTADAFKSFDATSGVVGVPTTRLREVTRMSSNSDLLRLDLDGAAQTLDVQAGALDCSLQLRDPNMIREGGSLDDAEYPSVVVMEGGDLKRIIRGAGYVDSRVELHVEHVEQADGRFVAKADDGDDRLIAPRDRDDLTELLVGEQSVRATFDLDYLKQARRAIRKCTEVTLALDTDEPLALAFDIADSAGHVEYGIAPMVETE
jgi:proliferating cell nuclear antigen